MRNEFTIIENILNISKDNIDSHPAIVIPPGDDAALLQQIIKPVISTDTHRENIHFKLDWASPEEIGFKAITVTLSDLAASYAEPVAVFINLGIPDYISDYFIDKLYTGVNQALRKYNCALGGGNISSSQELSLDLFAIGNGDDEIFPLRSKAEKGYGLYVTGPIGLAKAGLDALLKNNSKFTSVINSFKSPKARFDASKILKSYKVSCVMDISDGLLGDAEHIAAASDISIELSVDINSLSESLIQYCKKFNLSPVEFAIAGGEDYELLFTCSDETFTGIKKELPESFKVGNCLVFNGSRIINPPEKIESYRHK